MRFGIMTMQLSALIPSGITSPQNAMAQISQFDFSLLVRQLASHGFNPIELSGDLAMFMPQTFAPASIEKLVALKRELDITYTVHLPLWSVEPSTPLAPVRQGSILALVEIIRATQPLDPEDYVLHAYGPLASEFYRMNIPESARALLLQLFQANARDSIKTILAETGIPSRKLAIETIEFPIEMMLALVNELDTSICFDTGHVLAGFTGPIDFFDALEKCLPRISQIHFHDAPSLARTGQIGYGKDHQPLGNGDLDVTRFLNRLKQANYAGPLVFELTIAEALASMQKLE